MPPSIAKRFLVIFSNVQFFYVGKTGEYIHAKVLNIVESQVP